MYVPSTYILYIKIILDMGHNAAEPVNADFR